MAYRNTNFQRGSIFKLQHFQMFTFLYLTMYETFFKLLHWLYYMTYASDFNICEAQFKTNTSNSLIQVDYQKPIIYTPYDDLTTPYLP